jgi:hypothetical protein
MRRAHLVTGRTMASLTAARLATIGMRTLGARKHDHRRAAVVGGRASSDAQTPGAVTAQTLGIRKECGALARRGCRFMAVSMILMSWRCGPRWG